MALKCVTDAPTNGTEAFQRLDAKMGGSANLEIGEFVVKKTEDSWGDVTYRVEEKRREEEGSGPVFHVRRRFHLFGSNEYLFERLSSEGDFIPYGLSTEVQEASLASSLSRTLTNTCGVLCTDTELEMFAALFDLSVKTTCAK